MSTQDLLFISGGYTPVLTCVFPRVRWELMAVPPITAAYPKHVDTWVYHTLPGRSS